MKITTALGAPLRRAFCTFAVLALACAPSGGPPEVAPSGSTLGPSAAASAPEEAGPFAVIFATPTGESSETAQLSVVFNRSVRALTTAEDEAEPPFTLTPKVEGSWRPVGGRAYLFAPKGGFLPPATEYRLDIPAGFRSLEGETLGKPYSLTFRTPRPHVVRSEPYDGQNGLGPKERFELHFDQPIERAALEKSLSLVLGDAPLEKKAAVRIEQPDPKDEQRFVVVPIASLPPATNFALVLSAELRGKLGPLPSGEESRLTFRTYDRLTVGTVDCSRRDQSRPCMPDGSFWLELSNPARYADIQKAVRVSPALSLNWPTWTEPTDTVSYVELVGAFRPATKYTLEIAGDLTDVHGQKLGKTETRTFSVGDYAPYVEVGVTGDYLEAADARAVPIASVNVPSYRLIATAVSTSLVEKYLTSSDAGDAEAELQNSTKGYARTVSTGAPRNQAGVERVDLARLLEKTGGRGAVILSTKYKSEGEDIEQTKLLQVTDLGISAKLSNGETSVVWVTSLSTGAPVAGAEVRVVSPMGRGQAFSTNQDGIAILPPGAVPVGSYDDQERTFVRVAKGTDWTYRRVMDHLGYWQSTVPTDPLGSPQVLGLLFTERGIYRPGDKVQIKGILREQVEGGTKLVADRALTLIVRSPDWEVMRKVHVTTSAYGTFSVELPTERTAPLGHYRVQVEEFAAGYVSTSYELSEYRPTELSAKVESAEKSYVRGKEATFTVSGDYLFGAPMSGAGLGYRATRSETTWAVDGHPKLVFDASNYDYGYPERAPASAMLASGDERLDEKGRFVKKVPLSLPGQRGPELVSFDAEVRDVSRQTVASGTSVIVHAADVYVGLEPIEPYFVSAPAKIRPNALVTSPTGAVSAGRPITLELVRRRWKVVRETSGDLPTSVITTDDQVVSTCRTTSASTLAGCDLQLTDAGYYLVLAKTTDAKGRENRAAVDLYALGSGAASWPDDDSNRLQIATDKDTYRVGDVARVLVKSPFRTAEALITVESQGVTEQRRVRLDGATPTFTVPITDKMRPNAYVGVHLVRPRTAPPAASGADLGAPTYRVGHARLLVDPESRRLGVTLSPNKTSYGPGDDVKLDLTVKDRSGKGAEAEVTVYAVDEGVLSLIGYQVPDPLPVFTAPRPLRTATLESRDSLARVTTDVDALLGIGRSKGAAGGGGDEPGGSSGVRRDFRQSAYFNPAVLTGPDGKAHVEFKLPENLTTYRLMAVATTRDDRYGYAEQRVTSSRELMARPALPRVLRAGDVFDASVVVSAKAFGPAPVTVRLETTGLEANGPAERTIDLPKDGSVEVRFPTRAPRVGEAKLRFTVSSTAAGVTKKDVVELTRQVLSPSTLEVTSLYGQTKSAAAEALGDLGRVRKDQGGLDVKLSSTALVGLDASVEQLIDYPYECSEQLSSRLLPLLTLADLAKDFGAPLPENPKLFAESTLTELIRRQHGDGGFGMWSGSTESYPWVSAYAMMTIGEAKVRGYAISDAVYHAGIDYLRRQLEGPGEPLDLATRALVLDVLAGLGQPDAGYTTALYEQSRTLPAFARALLLHAMVLGKHPRADIDALVADLEGNLRVEANRAYYAENLGDAYATLLDSPLRTSALVLRALVAAKPQHPLGAKLARGLLDARKGSTWRNTQESAFALLALDAYRHAQEGEEPNFTARLWSGDQRLVETRFDGRSLAASEHFLPMASLTPAKLAFEKSGAGTLFYEARLRYALVDLPKEPLDRGFYLQKSYRPVTPSALDAALSWVPVSGTNDLPAGQLVVVDLIAVTPSPRHFVVIDDPLPAGLEPVNSSLATEASWTHTSGSISDSAPYPTDQALARGDAFLPTSYEQELRDDRALFFVDHLPAGMFHYRYLARATTLGTFVVPPTMATEMYTPEVFGRTGSRTVVVK